VSGRVICRTCGDVREGEAGQPCANCGVGPYSDWTKEIVPGLSNKRGNYDEQVEQIFIQLKAPALVLLIVLEGPLGSGFSVSGDAQRVGAIPGILRRIADDIEQNLEAQQSGVMDS
jgi:hypothetical protein